MTGGEVLPAFLGYNECYAGYGFWAAIEKPTRQFAGWFQSRPAPGSPPGEVQLGYRLRRRRGREPSQGACGPLDASN